MLFTRTGCLSTLCPHPHGPSSSIWWSSQPAAPPPTQKTSHAQILTPYLILPGLCSPGALSLHSTHCREKGLVGIFDSCFPCPLDGGFHKSRTLSGPVTLVSSVVGSRVRARVYYKPLTREEWLGFVIWPDTCSQQCSHCSRPAITHTASLLRGEVRCCEGEIGH